MLGFRILWDRNELGFQRPSDHLRVFPPLSGFLFQERGRLGHSSHVCFGRCVLLRPLTRVGSLAWENWLKSVGNFPTLAAYLPVSPVRGTFF